MQTWSLSLVLIWALSTHGCAWLGELDETRAVETAQADDRACRRAGHVWPGDAYVDCRRYRFDDRQREQWQELQMARQQQQPRVGIRPESPIEPYRPVREEGFRCEEAVTSNGESYIDCHEGS
ncbi:MAG TPA: hypothetical protein VF267_06460 [Gammaproteobacteria bacterium]